MILEKRKKKQSSEMLYELRIEFYSYIIIFEMQKQFKNGNFVLKLDKLLSNSEYEQIICWDSTKKYIDILDSQKMQTEVTPLFFRHSKFQSFVRQLNLYGFRKIKNQGRLRFTHPLILDGFPISSICTSKSTKNERKIKRISSDDSALISVVEQQPCEQIPQNSITVIQCSEAATRKQSQFQGVHCLRSNVWETQMMRNNYMAMRGQYMAWYNMMSMMSIGSYWPSMSPVSDLNSSISQ